MVELLIAMAIFAIVTGAALAIFRSTAESEARQQENLEQIQNLRAAFYTVSRDVRMAGNGLGMLGTAQVQVYVNPNPALYDADTQEAPGWFRYAGAEQYGARAIYGTDSGLDMNKADTLTIFRADLEAINSMGRLGADFTPGTSATITLQGNVTEGVDLSDGDIIALSTGTVSLILQARIGPGANTNVLSLGVRFRPDEAMAEPANFSFPSGTTVYNLKDVSFVTYSLDTAQMLLIANYHEMIEDENNPGTLIPNIMTVASNIEDFQLSYFLAPSLVTPPVSQPSFGEGDLVNQWVNAVRLGLVSRSDTKIAGGDGSNTGQPVDLMGHTASTESGFARRILVENIQLRNF